MNFYTTTSHSFLSPNSFFCNPVSLFLLKQKLSI